MSATLINFASSGKKERDAVRTISNYLSDDWYAVVPTTKRSKEGDLVLVSKDRVVFVEIKNSKMKFEKGGFYQLGRDFYNKENNYKETWYPKDPIYQMENVYRDIFSKQNQQLIFGEGSKKYVHKNFVLCTPESHAVGIPEELKKDISQLHIGNLNEDMENVLKESTRKQEFEFNDLEIKQIIQKIAPNADLISATKIREGYVKKQLVQATEAQKVVLKAYKNVDTFSVLGGAGTGKTLLAIDLIKRKLMENPNKNYLFACYTSRLHRDLLVGELPRAVKKIGSGTISSILSNVLVRLLKKISIEKKDFSEYLMTTEKKLFNAYFEDDGWHAEYQAFVTSLMLQPTFLHNKIIEKYTKLDNINFEDMKTELLSNLSKDSTDNIVAKKILETIQEDQLDLSEEDLGFDGLFCDEGQDISPPWYLFLSNLVVKEKYEFFIFYDLNQKVLGKSEFILPLDDNHPEIDLNEGGNCRSTDEISIFANLVIDNKTDSLQLRGIKGEPVEIRSNKNLEFLCKYIHDEIEILIQEKDVDEKDIAILYDSTTSDLADTVNKYFHKKYLHIQKDEAGVSGNIDSVRRFKGLERKYVFLVVNSSDFINNKKLIYVGATRATTHLKCIVLMDSKFDLEGFKKTYKDSL